jgi:hypothetical protein
MNRYTLLVGAGLVLSLAACKKDSNPAESSVTETLIDPATGWVKVATITHSDRNTGMSGRNAMIPYDLMPIGSDLAVLYSENSIAPSGVGVYRENAKVKINPATGTLSEATPMTEKAARAIYTQFIPGTYDPVFFAVSGGMHIGTDVAGKLLASFNVGNTFRPINFYTGGGFSMGGKQNGLNQSDAYYCRFPDKGSVLSTFCQWNGDSTEWLQATAFELAAQHYELVVSAKAGQVYFSVIQNDGRGVGVEHNFTMPVRTLIPGLAAADFRKDEHFILASTTLGNKYTVLLGKVRDDAAAISKRYVSEVYCLQWEAGASTFTSLYDHIAVPEDVGHSLYNVYQCGTEMPEAATIRFTPEGTAYTVCEMMTEADKNTAYTALVTIGSAGTRLSGKYTRAGHTKDYDQFGIAVCQYYNGAYYALAFPKNDVSYPYTHPRYRMELVKINP